MMVDYPTCFFSLICFQCSDNDFGGGDVSRDVLCEPGHKVNLIRVVFSR